MKNSFPVVFSLPQAHLIRERQISRSLLGPPLHTLYENTKALLQYIGQGKKGIRHQEYVAKLYDKYYGVSDEEWQKSDKERRFTVEYEGRRLVVDGVFLRDIHQQLISSLLSSIYAKNVLEVGSGRGNNTIELALCHPNLHFIGVERSQEGYRAGCSRLTEKNFPM